MSSKPWYAWYPGDYAADTRNLSPLEHGCYRQLLDSYYAMAEALPEALPQLYRICGAVEEHEKAAVQAVLNQFFTLQNNKFHNKRADDEIRKQAHIRETLSERGKAGATARWDSRSNATATNSGIAQAMADGMAYPQPQLQPQRKKETTNSTPLPGNGLDLPDWLPLEQWQAWIEARKKRRNPPTQWALKLALAKLDAYRQQGHAPAAILAQSAFRGWAGLFPIKDKDAIA